MGTGGPRRRGAAQPKKVTAKDRRYAALRELGERYRAAEAVTEAGREQIAADIEKLLDLGKNDAWKGAIKGRAAAVRDEDNRLNWAYCQYGVCAGTQPEASGKPLGASTATLPTRSTRRE